MEWGDEEAGDHSVIEGKLADLVNPNSTFVAGTKVQCRLPEGNYPATILVAGAG